jgi:hypothetical protein
MKFFIFIPVWNLYPYLFLQVVADGVDPKQQTFFFW